MTVGLGGGEKGPRGPWAGLCVGPVEHGVTVEVMRGPAASFSEYQRRKG